MAADGNAHGHTTDSPTRTDSSTSDHDAITALLHRLHERDVLLPLCDHYVLEIDPPVPSQVVKDTPLFVPTFDTPLDALHLVRSQPHFAGLAQAMWGDGRFTPASLGGSASIHRHRRSRDETPSEHDIRAGESKCRRTSLHDEAQTVATSSLPSESAGPMTSGVDESPAMEIDP